MTSSKTFKIGERARYGIWKVTIFKTKLMIQGIDWDSKNVEETKSFQIPYNLFELKHFLEDVTDYYHSEKIIDYIESKVKKKEI